MTTKKTTDQFTNYGGKLMVMSALVTAAAAWGKSVIDSQQDGHKLAIHALRHALPEDLGGHGDTSAVTALLASLRDRGDGKAHTYVTGLTRWLERYSTIYLKRNGNYGIAKMDDPVIADPKTGRQFTLGAAFKPWDIEAAFGDAFWKLTPAGVDKIMEPDEVVKLVDPTRTMINKIATLRDNNQINANAAFIDRLLAAARAAKVAFDRELAVGGTNAVEVGGDVAEGLQQPDAREVA